MASTNNPSPTDTDGDRHAIGCLVEPSPHGFDPEAEERVYRVTGEGMRCVRCHSLLVTEAELNSEGPRS